MEDASIVSDIHDKLDYSVITSNIFLNLSLEQVLKFCESNDDRRIKICNNLYIWRKYFEKNFNDEYNEYIQSLFSVYEETPDFYYRRIEYIYLRDISPELANVKKIRRNEGTSLPIIRSYDHMADLIYKAVQNRHFLFFYKLFNYKRGDQKKLRKHFYYRIIPTIDRYERSIPIEFLELVYLKLGLEMDDFLKKAHLLYGTGYYLDSIKRITKNKAIFYGKMTSPFADSRGNYLDMVEAFMKFPEYFLPTDAVIRYYEDFRSEIMITYYKRKRTDAMPSFENALVFFTLSLRYLDYEEETIHEIVKDIRKFLQKVNIIIKKRGE